MTPVLRQYQVEVIDAVRDLFTQGYRRVLLVAPTGAGKTVMAADLIRRLRASGQHILFLAGARELIFQTSAKLADIDVEYGIIMAGVRERVADVQVASVQTLARRDQMPVAHVIFIDEADLARAKTYEKILAFYPDALVIGMTGTPWRSDGKGLGELFQASVVAATPRALMDAGFLVDFDAVSFVPLDLGGVKSTAGDYDAEEQGRRATKTEDGKRLAGDIVREYTARAAGRRAVCFAVTIEHSKMLAEQFVAAGVPAEHLDGEMPADDRAAIIARLRAGTTHVVCNVGVLTRGVDIPPIEVVILARATKSLSLFLQMVGRGLRPCAGKTRALILDHAGCIVKQSGGDVEPVHGFPDDERDYSLTADEKKRAKTTNVVRITQCRACFSVIRSGPETCPSCGAVLAKPRAEVSLETVAGRAIEGQELRRATAAPNPVHVVAIRDLIWMAQDRGWKPAAVAMKFKAEFHIFPNKALLDAGRRAAGIRTAEAA